MRVVPLNSCDDVALWSAKRIINKINTFKPTPQKPFVLGLPTGGTPLKTYKKLIEFYNKGIVSFKNVVTFNMDEYVGLEKNNPQSYHYFMHQHFFSKIDILPENINLLDGMSKNYEEVCLNEQIFVMDGKIKINKLISNFNDENTSNFKIINFYIYKLGQE